MCSSLFWLHVQIRGLCVSRGFEEQMLVTRILRQVVGKTVLPACSWRTTLLPLRFLGISPPQFPEGANSHSASFSENRTSLGPDYRGSWPAVLEACLHFEEMIWERQCDFVRHKETPCIVIASSTQREKEKVARAQVGLEIVVHGAWNSLMPCH
jgi:hypothetical protein